MRAHALGLALLAACSGSSTRTGPPTEEAAPVVAVTVTDAAPPMPARLRAWAEAWRALRECMVGASPAAADLVEANAAQQLLRGTDRCAASYAQCEKLAGEAALDDTEAPAWDAVLAAVEAMPSGWLVGDPGERILDAGQISVVETAAAAIYHTAALAAPVPPVGPPLPVLTRAAPIAGTENMMMRVLTAVDHVVEGWLAYGTQGQGLVIASGPDQIVFDRYEDDTPLASGSWTAITRGRKVLAGAHDGKGGIARGALVMRGRDLVVAGTFGEGADRAVVVTAEALDGYDRVWIVRSADSGARWEAPVRIGDDAVYVTGSERALELYWDHPDKTGALWLHVDGPGELRDPTLLPGRVDLGNTCSAGGSLWWTAPDQGELHHVDVAGVAHALGVSGSIKMHACTRDALAIETDDGVAGCGADGCKPAARHGGRNRVVDVLAPGEVVEAATDGNVLAVWEGGAVRLFRIEDSYLNAVVRWGERTYVGFEAADGISFSPLP